MTVCELLYSITDDMRFAGHLEGYIKRYVESMGYIYDPTNTLMLMRVNPIYFQQMPQVGQRSITVLKTAQKQCLRYFEDCLQAIREAKGL